MKAMKIRDAHIEASQYGFGIGNGPIAKGADAAPSR
jgi:hypothetical protein